MNGHPLSSRYTYSDVPLDYVLQVRNLHQSNDPTGEIRRLATGHPNGKVPPYVCQAIIFDRTSGRIEAVGVSVCSPKDVPNKKVGRFIATGRAVKEFLINNPQPEIVQHG